MFHSRVWPRIEVLYQFADGLIVAAAMNGDVVAVVRMRVARSLMSTTESLCQYYRYAAPTWVVAIVERVF
jgi:hypothetical protein